MKRPSIRTRLLLWSTILTTVILVGAGCFLYDSLKKSLYSQFDSLLDEAATVVMIEVEVKESMVYHEWKESLGDHALYKNKTLIQVWDYHSDESVRSSALGDFDLERSYGRPGERVFFNLALPNGKRGRGVGVLIYPRVEYPEGNEGFVPEDHPQIFVLAQNTEGLSEIFDRCRRTFLISGASVIALLWGAIWLVISLSSRAMNTVTKEVLARAGTEVGCPIPVPDNLPSEISGMAEKFNELLSRIDDSREKDRDFFLNIAHEVRTPLAGVHAVIEQALRHPRETKDYQRRLKQAFEGTTALRSLINRLMRFGRLKRSGGELDIEPIDVNDLLKRLWGALCQKASVRQLEVDWNLDDKSMVESDFELVKVVVSNVLENAVTYASEGTRISLETMSGSGKIRLLVGNSIEGQNIKAGELSRFFDPFYRKDQSREQKGAHAGIGLSFCREIMDLLGGEITVSLAGSERIVFEIVIPSSFRP